jgi:hypothetical protein
VRLKAVAAITHWCPGHRGAGLRWGCWLARMCCVPVGTAGNDNQPAGLMAERLAWGHVCMLKAVHGGNTGSRAGGKSGLASLDKLTARRAACTMPVVHVYSL